MEQVVVKDVGITTVSISTYATFMAAAVDYACFANGHYCGGHCHENLDVVRQDPARCSFSVPDDGMSVGYA